MTTRQSWVGVFVLIAVLLLISTVPGHADYGRYGYTGYGYRCYGHSGHWHKGHWHRRLHRSRGVRVFISPGLVVPFGAYWGPYPAASVVITPPPRVYVIEPPPPPPHYWYYCDAAQAYYPYVHQCPGGWRQVVPTPPR
jgi:hypothetical protein